MGHLNSSQVKDHFQMFRFSDVGSSDPHCNKTDKLKFNFLRENLWSQVVVGILCLKVSV